MTPFVHVHTHAGTSLLDGIPSSKSLAFKAARLGQPALALTDHGFLFGAVRHYQACQEAGIKPVLGLETYMTRAGTMAEAKAAQDKGNYHLTLLAATNEGWRNLVALASLGAVEGFYYKPRIDREVLEAHRAGLIVLSGCMSSEVSKQILNGDPELHQATAVARWYRDVFGDAYYIEAHEHGLADEPRLMAGLREVAKRTGVPLVPANDIHYLDREDARLHDTLMKVQTGGKYGGFGTHEFYLKSGDEMVSLGFSVEECLRTVDISERCNVTLELGGKQEFPVPAGVPEGADEAAWLRNLAFEGLDRRYPISWGAERPDQRLLLDRLEYELDVIERTGYTRYVLIVADMVSWARQQGIPSTARGSAAGSLVLYAIGVTPVDPLRYGLLFSRFLNEGRTPDVDLDVADSRRAEVFNYVAQTYGHDRVAQIVTFSRMGGRAAIRDVGRAMGVPLLVADTVAKLIPEEASGEATDRISRALETVPELRDLETAFPGKPFWQAQAEEVLEVAAALEGTPRSEGQHAAGLALAAQPLLEMGVPLTRKKNDDGVDLPLTQYEMRDLEAAGITKFDILGLANLTILADTKALIRQHRGIDLDVDGIPDGDPLAYDLLGAGETIGVFQLGSGAMRRYLRDLRPSRVEDLMAMVALYRPGPMKFIKTYIGRKHGEQEPETYHPLVEPVLRETFGLIIYQEAIMGLARVAGFDAAETDKFLKGVRKKLRSVLEKYEGRFTEGLVAAGVPADTAARIWQDIQPAADYSFNKSHAAAYGWLAYQTAYLKAHYAPEYMAALLTSEARSNAKDREARLAMAVTDARRLGVPVLGPDINRSGASFAVEAGVAVRFGLAGIKGVGNVALRVLLEARASGGFFSLDDLRSRCPKAKVNVRVLEALTKAGALDSLGPRSRLLKQLGKLDEAAAPTKVDRLAWERETLGLTVSDSPLAPWTDRLDGQVTHWAVELPREAEKEWVTVGGVVNEVRTLVTRRGDRMAKVTLEDHTGDMTVTFWPERYRQYEDELETGRVLVVNGTVNHWEEQSQVVCRRAEALGKEAA